MVTLNVSLIQIQGFLLIFLRVGAILFSAPIFNYQGAPTLFKIGLAISISFLLYPLVKLNLNGFDMPLVIFFLMVASEIALGLIIGFAMQTIFVGVQLAGQIAGFQMGLSIVNVIDPSSNMQVPILSQFLNLFAMLVLLSTNAHYWFIKALTESFLMVPPLGYHINSGLIPPILTLVGNIFVIAIKASAPIIVSLLLTTVALGILAKTVPQMHIFIVAMPLKIIIGLIFLGLTMPFLAAFLNDLFSGFGSDIVGLIRLVSK